VRQRQAAAVGQQLLQGLGLGLRLLLLPQVLLLQQGHVLVLLLLPQAQVLLLLVVLVLRLLLLVVQQGQLPLRGVPLLAPPLLFQEAQEQAPRLHSSDLPHHLLLLLLLPWHLSVVPLV
jgi:hypothetical protein